jgi:hypothetical protein
MYSAGHFLHLLKYLKLTRISFQPHTYQMQLFLTKKIFPHKVILLPPHISFGSVLRFYFVIETF